MSTIEIPKDGFAVHSRINQVTRAWEPLYSRVDEHGVFVLALWVGLSHCNNQAILHGGVLAALADSAMGVACARNLPANEFARTIGLHVDFMEAAPLGSWLEIRAGILKSRRSIIFANAQVFSNDRLVAIVSATFAIRKSNS